MRIAILKLGAIGDIILTTPFVRQLRHDNPEAIIDYWVGKYSSKVLFKNKNISNVIVFDESIFTGNVFGWLRFIQRIRKKDYDMMFLMDKHWIFNLTAYLTGIRARIGFDRHGEGILLTRKVPYFRLRHEAYYYLDLLKAAGFRTDYSRARPEIYYQARRRKKILGMIPDGMNFRDRTKIRLWPAENYAALSSRLDYPIFIFGTDKERAEQIIRESNNKNMKSMVGKSFADSASLMSGCACIVTNDCGGMHMASCTGVKIIGLFGPTNPKRKAPFGSIYIWHGKKSHDPNYELYGRIPKGKAYNSIESITVNEVLREVRKIMKARV